MNKRLLTRVIAIVIMISVTILETVLIITHLFKPQDYYTPLAALTALIVIATSLLAINVQQQKEWTPKLIGAFFILTASAFIFTNTLSRNTANMVQFDNTASSKLQIIQLAKQNVKQSKDLYNKSDNRSTKYCAKYNNVKKCNRLIEITNRKRLIQNEHQQKLVKLINSNANMDVHNQAGYAISKLIGIKPVTFMNYYVFLFPTIMLMLTIYLSMIINKSITVKKRSYNRANVYNSKPVQTMLKNSSNTIDDKLNKIITSFIDTHKLKQLPSVNDLQTEAEKQRIVITLKRAKNVLEKYKLNMVK